jgi:hypothetical protein
LSWSIFLFENNKSNHRCTRTHERTRHNTTCTQSHNTGIVELTWRGTPNIFTF